MKNWYKIYATGNYAEANIIKGLLEENNIQAVLLNRQDSNYICIGELELYVPLHYKDVAVHLLSNPLFKVAGEN